MESKQPLLWSDPGHAPVRPIEPAAPWVGGKRNLAAEIVTRIHDTAHQLYAEPFVGMGGVFFRRSLRPKAEVINDKNRDVATLFRILQLHYVPFVDMIRWQLTTRDAFEKLKATDPATLTDLHRAARFLYLQRTAFGGKVTGQNFGVSPFEPAAFDPTRITPLLEAVHARLAGVTIECLDYGDFLARYDRPETLFYLDPPYHGSEDYYGQALFSPSDHARLAQHLRGLKGRFILSINDTPAMRTAFAGFKIDEVATTYTLQESGAAAAKELIISGPN
jgi:DNA adenine methylase